MIDDTPCENHPVRLRHQTVHCHSGAPARLAQIGHIFGIKGVMIEDPHPFIHFLRAKFRKLLLTILAVSANADDDRHLAICQTRLIQIVQ